MNPAMNVEQTPLSGVVILTPARFGDARGFFAESWNRKRMAEAGLAVMRCNQGALQRLLDGLGRLIE